MSLIKLSIIIPFYKVEKFIGQCLDSIYNQDINEVEYEVICVNDCSPDKSKDIVLEYQKIHQNLKLIEHETNKMQGAARNTGLKSALGEYVWFIDSDDFIQPNVLKKMISLACSNQLEILHFNIQRVDVNGIFSEYHANYQFNTKIITGIDYYEIEYPIWKKSVETWSKIYKREFLINNNLFYPVGIYFEDAVHTIKSILKSSKFQYLNETIYNYRLNPFSSTMNNTIYTSGRKLADLIRLFIGAITEFKKSDIIQNKKSEIINYYLNLLIKNRKNTFYLSNNERKIFYSYTVDIDFEIIRSFTSIKKFSIYKSCKTRDFINNIFSPPLRFFRSQKRKYL